jgi:hypothetical protein
MAISDRGFASMDPKKRSSIASKGGKEAHRRGTAHKFTSESGRAAAAKRRKKATSNRMVT